MYIWDILPNKCDNFHERMMSADIMTGSFGYHGNVWAGRIWPNSSSTTSSSVKGGKAFNRPKSTPASFRRGVTSGGQSLSTAIDPRPQTALGMSVTGCDRVAKEPTRKHNLDSHLPSKKTKPPPWQTKLDGTPVQCVVAPGYMLSRSKSKMYMYIKTDDFFNQEQDAVKPTKKADPERDTFITQLQQQIEDLTLYLEEERLNHRETKRKAADVMKDKTDELSNQHSNFIRQLQEEHAEEMEKARLLHEKSLNNQIDTSEAALAKMRGEMVFLQGAFDSYKSQLLQDIEEKWTKKEEEIQVKHKEEMQQRIHELKARMISERAMEKSELSKEHQKDTHQMRKEHKKELDSLLRRFSNVAADLENLKQTQDKLASLEQDHERLNQEFDEVCSQLTETTRDLTESKVRLVSYEANFQDKVQEVEDKYQGRIHDLMSQNTELRKVYMKKCGELYDEKSVSEKTRLDQLSSAKSTMKHRHFRKGETATVQAMRRNVLVERLVQNASLGSINRSSSTPVIKH